MNPKYLTIVLGLMLTLTCSVSAINTTPIKTQTKGDTLYVGGTGLGNYTRIQDAIDNASNGDTVFVYSGIYFEHVRVKKEIELIGENRDTTIIDANGSSLPIFLEVGAVLVTGFTLQNSGNKWYNDAGIGIKNFAYASHGNIITGNKMVNNYAGFFSWASDNNVISNNIIINNRDDGIYFQAYCHNNTIADNIITNNGDVGIYIIDSDYNDITRNYIANNMNNGVFLGEFGNKFHENIVTNETAGLTIDMGTLCLRNTFSQNEIGIISHGGMGCTVKQNNFIANDQHATFMYFLGQRLFIPLFINPQITRWIRNYWGGHILGPKLIYGDILGLSIRWMNIDLFPRRIPYKIGG